MYFFKNLYLLGVKTFQATTTKQDLGTSAGFFQIYDEHPRPFYIGVPFYIRIPIPGDMSNKLTDYLASTGNR